jgi:hypothetical protein
MSGHSRLAVGENPSRVHAPKEGELTELARRVAQRVGHYLERQGLLPCDAQNSYLTGDRVL